MTPGLVTTRGSADVYVVDTTISGVVKAFTKADKKFTMAATGSIADTANIFVNGQGPYAVNGAVSTADIIVQAAGTQDHDFANADFTHADIKFPVYKTAVDSFITTGKILMLNGRRYKVKSSDTNLITGKATLTENFAGGQLLQLCSSCITTAAADGLTLTSDKKLSIAAGDYIAVGSYVHADLMTSIETVVTDEVSVTTSAGSMKGTPVMVNIATALASEALPLYREVNTNRYVGSIITEVDTANPFQYVSQCSNRGTCDSATGVCKCFKGYSNDNCDNQNMLAM